MSFGNTNWGLELKLKTLGANRYDLMLPETRALKRALKAGEEVQGIVYGRYSLMSKDTISRGLLVATNKRVFLLNTKPFFKQNDEISYFVISGVSYTRVAFSGTVTLHAKTGDINMRTFNDKCAQTFVRAIETRIIADSVTA